MSKKLNANSTRMYQANTNMDAVQTQHPNSHHQSRKPNKYHHIKNQSGKQQFHHKNNIKINEETSNQQQMQQCGMDIVYQNNYFNRSYEINATVPVSEPKKSNMYAPNFTGDQSLNECNDEENLICESISCSPTTSNEADHKMRIEETEERMVSNSMNESTAIIHNNTQIVYDQQLSQNQFVSCSVPQMVEMPGQQTNEFNNQMYNGIYEYDYQSNPQILHQQQSAGSQFYIYHPYTDYTQGTVPISNVSGSPLNNSFNGTPQQQPTAFYTTYQTIPSYIYDPSMGSYTNMAYSPVQHQQTPNTQISSPQQTNILASYQTPPQPAHQLYLQTSNITPPTSLSPNDTGSCSNNSSATVGNDRTSNCNSPHLSTQNVISANQQQITQTPLANTSLNQNPYSLMYANTNPYLTPQAYPCQSPIPSAQYMMYHPPPQIQIPPQQQQQLQIPFQSNHNSPIMHTPYNNNNNHHNTNNNNHHNNGPKSNKSRFNKYNKRNQKYNYLDQTPQSTCDESVYMNSPVANKIGYESECVNEDASQSYLAADQTMPMYPTSSYCDPNTIMGMPNAEAILNAGLNYDALNGIETYGEDYGDAYDDNNNTEENDENLACQICRGRRMCFCYFLKVRYYKFPSFFDLVDHQYKKWRSTMAKNNGLMMNSPNSNMGIGNNINGCNINANYNNNINHNSNAKKA